MPVDEFTRNLASDALREWWGGSTSERR